MFDSIHHNRLSDDKITCASYYAGDDVFGLISFSANGERCEVLSSIGPIEAMRHCSASHFLGKSTGRLLALSDEEISDYS